MFFSSSKCVRGLSAPIKGSPSTQSPSVEHTTEGTPHEKSIQAEHYVRPSRLHGVSSYGWSNPHNLVPRPLHYDRCVTPFIDECRDSWHSYLIR